MTLLLISDFTFDMATQKLYLIFTLFLQCGVADGEGFLSIWQVNQTASNPKPYVVSITQYSRGTCRGCLVCEVFVSDSRSYW